MAAEPYRYTGPRSDARCGNRAHSVPGEKYDQGCTNQVAMGYNPLRLCADCLVRYPAHGDAVWHVGHAEALPAPVASVAAAKSRPSASVAAGVVALPLHEPCGLDGGGRVAEGAVLVCAVVRTFERVGEAKWATVDRPGCGGRFGLCHGCGLRSIRDGGACASCGKAGERTP